MGRRLAWIGIVVACIAVGGIAWRTAGHGHHAAARGARASGQAAASAGAWPALPEGSVDLHRRLLEQRASRGDAVAAYRLGAVLSQCRDYRPIADGVFARALVESADLLRRMVGSGAEDDGQLALDLAIREKARMDVACAGSEATRAAAKPGDAERWLALAASRGYPPARVEYPAAAFVEYRTAADLLDHADEVARRRDRARGWLAAAYRAGDPEALFAYAKAYGRGNLFPRDREAALGWWLAYRSTAAGRDMDASLARLIDRQARTGLGPASVRRAEESARALRAGLGRGP